MPKYQSKYKGNQIDNLLDFVNDNKDNLALKEEIPEIPSIPRNVSELSNDLGFITNTVNNLINYYKKSETYTKSEINNIVSAAASGGFIKVSELPTEDINIKAIYLVPYTGSRAKNLYEEYIYVDGDWEMIGTTKIDLSNYVTITALNTALADYLTSESFNTQIANYYNKTEIAGLLADKIDNNKIGATNGVASLDNNGKVPSSQLPEQQSVESTDKAKSSAIAPVFDETATYAAGDRVTYEDELYVFNKAHTGAWDAADADKSDVDSEIPDAMTASDLQDVKNAFSGMNQGAPLRMMHYSTDEQVVGTWIDGKPIYQRTFVDDTVRAYNVGWFEVPNSTIENLDDLVSVSGTAVWRDSSGKSIKDVIPENINGTEHQVSMNFVSRLAIYAKTGANRSWVKFIITVQYTKTTD